MLLCPENQLPVSLCRFDEHCINNMPFSGNRFSNASGERPKKAIVQQVGFTDSTVVICVLNLKIKELRVGYDILKV